jgi:[acyl-carrier-protein] S-malonyltransferase
MGRRLLGQSALARAVFATAEDLSGLPLQQLCVSGPESRLRAADVVEPALTALALAYAGVMHERGYRPDFVAGYSAGEVAALYCAGVLSLADALRVAILRGRWLQQVPGVGTRMAAVSGIAGDDLKRILDRAADEGPVFIAGWNAPDHHTIVGMQSSVRSAARQVAALSGQVSDVDVAGPWHCPLAASAVEPVAEALRQVEFHPPSVPLYMSYTGGMERDPTRIRQYVALQLAAPVQWLSVIRGLLTQGVDHFVELGAGSTLSGLVKRARRAGFATYFMEHRGRDGVPLETLAQRLPPPAMTLEDAVWTTA